MGNNVERRDFDLAASGQTQDNFNAIAQRLEGLIDRRDREVKAAMADYSATGISEDYAAKEARWNRVAGEVRTIIATLRTSLEKNDATAQDTMKKARAAVDSIG